MNNQQPQPGQKPKKKSKATIWIIVIIFIAVIGIIASTTDGDNETNTNTSQIKPQVNSAINLNTADDIMGSLLDYDIVEEEEYYTFECGLMEVHITVPEGASQVDIDYTIDYIIDDYLFIYDDVIVWVDNTGDMEEYIVCE